MEPVSRVISRESTRSYLERELIVSLDDGKTFGPTLETMDTRQESISSSVTIDQIEEKIDTEVIEKKHLWWKRNKDSTDPRQYSSLKKNSILFVVAIIGSISPISSTVYYPALVTMQEYFNTTATAMNASVAIFIFFTAFFPLVWATFSDLFGRRKIYIISFSISFIGSVCCAVSVNIEMFIVFRAFSAIGSSSAMAMGAGTIADIYEPHERGRAFAYYLCGPLVGPAIGPIIGGYLNQGLGWRSTFVFLAIYVFISWLGIVFLLPETWRPPSSKIYPNTKEDVENMEAQKPPKQRRRFVNPLAALKLFVFPNISLTVAFTSCLFFVLYLNSTVFTRIYTLQYDFESGLVGICYLPSAVGSMLGGVVGGKISDKLYTKSMLTAKENNQETYPEMRLGLVFFFAAIILQLLAFVAYGWCVEKDVHFAYGLVCQFFIGFALMLPNVTLNTYMVDCFRTQGASVTACNNFARYIMAGVGSLISSDILDGMRAGPLFTFCGCLLLVAFIVLPIVKRYHYKWSAMRTAFNS